jgi:hypothetical protein
MTRCDYIAIRILLCVAETVASYGFKSEIQNLTRDIKELIKQELAETLNPPIIVKVDHAKSA